MRDDEREASGGRMTNGTYPALDGLRVIDAMHPALITCSPDSSLRTIARMMATYRVHAILVTTHGEEELSGGGHWGIVSDTELLRAAEAGSMDDDQARTLAAQPVVTIPSSERLGRAAQLMAERDVSHLIVIESRSARPIGVLSTLDVARALAGLHEEHSTFR
jgi:CBS domain-containing protein